MLELKDILKIQNKTHEAKTINKKTNKNHTLLGLGDMDLEICHNILWDYCDNKNYNRSGNCF